MNNFTTNDLKSLGVFKDFSDGSIKSVFENSNKGILEFTLLFNKPEFDVLCVPTHHFCNLGCKMCHLTNKGLNKQMIPVQAEDFIEALVKSVCYVNEWQQEKENIISKEKCIKRTQKKKLLISFMGVGEPLLNLSLIEKVYLNEEYIKNILEYSDIGYAVSTMMPNDNVEKLNILVSKYNIPLKLHFSLHSPFDEERFDLIPSAKINIKNALSHLLDYRNTISLNQLIMNEYVKFHSSKDPIELHYTLIKNKNDSHAHLGEMITLLREFNIPIKFIRFNPINTLERSNMEQMWVESIQNSVPGLRVKTYSPPGREIGSSCGEFTKHYYHEEIETPQELEDFKDWESSHKIYENHRKNYITWDEYYMGIAVLSARRSKDPSTQVGACIVSEDNKLLSVGYNGTPNAIADDAFNWERTGNFTESKYAYVIHAEANAILNFHGNTSELKNATLYVTLFPCNECAKFIAQCGIKKIMFLSDKYSDSQETIAAKRLFNKCNISYRRFEIGNSTLSMLFDV